MVVKQIRSVTFIINCKCDKKFWEELVAYVPLIRHGLHRKQRVQQYFCCCLCNRCRGNGFTDQLPGNVHIQTHELIGGI
jgi:hypothetical protein